MQTKSRLLKSLAIDIRCMRVANKLLIRAKKANVVDAIKEYRNMRDNAVIGARYTQWQLEKTS